MAIIEILKRTARPVVCLGLLTASTCGFGAAAVPQPAVPQVTQAVNNKQRVTLQGNVRLMPKRAHDLGLVDPSAPASRILLLLKRPAPQEAALRQFIAEAHAPGSANYRQWLTPAQLGSEYGPAESDVQAVVAWLQSQGLAVAKVSQARTTIEFSGTAGQVESAFATKIHSFQLDGVARVSNTVNPQIPAALAPVIAGISPLNDFHPKALHTAPQGRSATPAPTSANPRAMSIQPSGTGSNITVPTSNGGNGYYLTPADVANIYNTPTSLNTVHPGTLTGDGIRIGIAGDSNVDLSNVANYRSLFGLPANVPTVVVDGTDPGTGTDDEVEALLDLEVASALAPTANLTLYTAQDTTFQSGLFLAIQRALDDNTIGILNVSFGGCEASEGIYNTEIVAYWEQAAAQGISVTVSTGDSGSAGCDDSNTENSAIYGLQVNGLASTPYNIAVGGTDFNQNSSNESTYWNATNSTTFGSAKGPIPEIPWNDSTSTIGALANNVPTTIQGATNIAGAGGGFSNCLNPTFDSAGNIASCPNTVDDPGFYPKPSWQSGFGTESARELPDVSLFSADGLHDSAWVICASGLGGNPNGADCTPDPTTGEFTFQTVGGTSASSPAFAGMLALVTQQLNQAQSKTNLRLGQADYALYALATQFPASFHDVTTGNNSVVCTAGTTNCGTNGFLTGYDAVAGSGAASYDLASGLGSVDATQLVQNWSKLTFTATTTALQLNGATSPITIQHGTSVNVAASVTGSGGTPSGNIALVTGSTLPGSAVSASQAGTLSPAIFALTNGAASGTDPYLPGSGSTPYTVTANYAGDGTFGPSISNGISVTVTPEPSELILDIEEFLPNGNGESVTSVTYGTWVSVNAQPFSAAQYSNASSTPYFSQATGSVKFTSTAAVLNQLVPINSNGFAEIPGQTSLAYPPGTYTVSASYAGDPSFMPSTAAAQTFVVTQAATSMAAASGTTSGTVAVQVDPLLSTTLQINPGTQLPSGTVTIKNSSGATAGTGVLAAIQTPQGTVSGATITLTPSALVSGSNTLSISYPGDTNYSGSTLANFMYNYTPGGGTGTFTLSAAPDTITVPSGSSGTTTMSIAPQSGFTGTVKLTCSVAGGPTCSLAKASVAVTGTAAVTDVLTVAAGSASSALHIPANPSRGTWYAAGGAAFAGILLFGLPGRRRAWQRMLSLMLLVVAIGVVGCGGTSSSNNNGTNYTVTVMAVSTSANQSITQTTTVTATVQ